MRARLTLCAHDVLAGFKRPRFKKIGMRRAKKTKLAVAEAEKLMAARMAAAGGGQVPAEAKLELHSRSSVAVAPAQPMLSQSS